MWHIERGGRTIRLVMGAFGFFETHDSPGRADRLAALVARVGVTITADEIEEAIDAT